VCVCACVAGRVRVCVCGVRWRVGVCLRAGSLTYPACNAYVPCCHCGLSGVIEISTLPHKRHDFREKVFEHKMCVFTLCTNFIWNICYFKKNSARYYHKSTRVSKWSAHYSCQILVTLEFSLQVFEKRLNNKFHENPSSGSRVVPCERTDKWTHRHDEANSRFSKFCGRS
jgi:hypothetical protein